MTLCDFAGGLFPGAPLGKRLAEKTAPTGGRGAARPPCLGGPSPISACSTARDLWVPSLNRLCCSEWALASSWAAALGGRLAQARWVQTRWGFETPLPPPNCIGYHTPVLQPALSSSATTVPARDGERAPESGLRLRPLPVPLPLWLLTHHLPGRRCVVPHCVRARPGGCLAL